MIELKNTAGNVRLTTPTIIAGGGGSIDLSNYYTKAEVDAKIPDVSGFITEIPSEYVTESELAAKGYLTEHQSLDGYALKSEIPDVSGFALKTEIPDVSGYQTEAQVIALINANIPSSGEEVSY